MKKKDKATLQSMKPAELVRIIRDEKKKLAEYLINRYSKQSKNVREGTALKRKISVASTVLRAKEIIHE